jgi:predicted PurR-regulated permease PerM
MNSSVKIPYYAKTALISMSILAFIFTVYIGQDIIIPIVYSVIIAILLNPFVNFLIRKRTNKIVAITIAVGLIIILCLLVFYIISTQISIFSETYPLLKQKLNAMGVDFLQWFSEKFNIHQSKINTWIGDTEKDFINNFEFQEKIAVAGHMIIVIMLMPVYVFMILYYKPLLLEFISKVFKSRYDIAVKEVLESTKRIIQSYLVGLFFEMIIIAILNSIALLIIGVDYAIILGVTGAIINIIPYIGGVIAILLPMLIAFVTKDSVSYTILVFLAYILIQFIDNHYIIPKIVASRVKINALISVITVLIGNAIWGVPGMFISIPLMAILKVILDHIEPLKPYGFLIGELESDNEKLPFYKKLKHKLFYWKTK